LKQGIEELIDENKDLKRELDKMQIQVEQLEIDKSYLLQRQQLQGKD
jgi:cell division septum initiation protein DivIVA